MRSLGFQSLRAASGRAIFSTFQQLAFPRSTSRVSSTAAHAITQNGGPLRTGPSELRKGLCGLRSRTRRHRQGHLGEQGVPVRGGARTVVKTTAREQLGPESSLGPSPPLGAGLLLDRNSLCFCLWHRRQPRQSQAGPSRPQRQQEHAERSLAASKHNNRFCREA